MVEDDQRCVISTHSYAKTKPSILCNYYAPVKRLDPRTHSPVSSGDLLDGLGCSQAHPRAAESGTLSGPQQPLLPDVPCEDSKQDVQQTAHAPPQGIR